MIILIGGGSCSGKTTLAQLLATELNIPLISLDQFFRRDDPTAPHITLNNQQLFDCNHPETIDLPLALAHINQNPAPKIIEGHFALTYPELRTLANIKVFITCPPKIREQRRLTRDLANKKGTPEQILAYYQASAIPGFEKHIAPSQIHADLNLSGEEDPKVNLNRILEHLQS
ncbi:hypothetical protein CCB80_13370 [Armatimonadetes bacterium Uphvl-Ar1]|nr:hypothetical protein CCB80_13370 [Armatimonadetes bacterium Uphvl-Ar1]